jgi:alkanesulfonate monooxygenase SsuD/methylene tetrahydromethanopterin reductase-like flavin-dependent oxidoreductase (luciferase family)
MKLGMFYEMYVPPAELGDPGAEARIIRETVDQIVVADQLGWDYVWLTEHHFLRQFSHMSAAEVLFGAAAYATDRIRFGFGLALTPPAYNHPVRIAERVAMLDCLSGGRVDMGSGRSTTPSELYGFGIDPEDSRAMWQEGLEAVALLLANEEVALDGKFVKMPARTVVPRPVQKPHPPLWVGGVGPGNAERAAQRGLGLLFFANNTSPEALESSITAYRDAIGSAVPFVPGGVNNQTAGFINCLCTLDETQRDRIRWLAATKMVEHTLHGATYMTSGWPDPENIPASYAHVTSGDTQMFLEAIRADPDAVAKQMLDAGMVAAGTPSDCMEVLDRFRDVGVDQVIMHMQMGGVPHADIVASIEALGKEVLPRYQ